MILNAGDRDGQAQAAREGGQPGGGLARPDRGVTGKAIVAPSTRGAGP